MSKPKLLSKSFKIDSGTAKLLENMVTQSGTTQSDVMRHLINQANAKEVASISNKWLMKAIVLPLISLRVGQ